MAPSAGMRALGSLLVALSIPTAASSEPTAVHGTGATLRTVEVQATVPYASVRHLGLVGPARSRPSITSALKPETRAADGALTLPPPAALIVAFLAGVIGSLRIKSARGSWALASLDVKEDEDPKSSRDAIPAFNRMGQEKEIDSQYRKLRLLFYVAIGAVCGILSIVDTVQVATLLSDPASPAVGPTLIDLSFNALAVAFVAVLYRIDRVPEEKLLVRTEEGGALATLRVRYGDDRVLVGGFRRQDGGQAGKRVLILGCNPFALESHLQYLRPNAGALAARDLVLIPVALPMTRAATIDHALAYRSLDRSLFQGPHIAAPNGGDWVSVFGAECDKALAAGVLPVESGFALFIDREGRVARRIPGLPSLEELLSLPEE
jgi:hypothetical protein